MIPVLTETPRKRGKFWVFGEDFLHTVIICVLALMKLKIGGDTLLRVHNQWFRRILEIFDISIFSDSIMIQSKIVNNGNC